jgi:hypothetical protein
VEDSSVEVAVVGTKNLVVPNMAVALVAVTERPEDLVEVVEAVWVI